MSARSQVKDGAESGMPASVLCNQTMHSVENWETKPLVNSPEINEIEVSQIATRVPRWDSASQWHLTEDEDAHTIVTVPDEVASRNPIDAVSSAKCGWEDSGSKAERSASSLEYDPPGIELDNLPMDLRIRMLRYSALVGVECMVRLGSVSKNFARAMLELQTEDPSVLRGVRQNQRIYQEIQSQLLKERFRRNRLNLIKGWTRENDCPSFWKLLFDQPGIVPYHPPYASICTGLLLMVFSWKILASLSLVYDRVLLALLGIYGGIISLTGVLYLFCMLLNSNFLLMGLLVLFLLLLGTQLVVVLLSVSVFVHDESRLSCLPIVLSFMVSLWTIILHARVGFEAGVRRAYATVCFALSVVAVAYYLMTIG